MVASHYVTCLFVAPYIAHISSQIRFLGGKRGKALAEEYDVSTVGDLLCVFVPYSELYVR